jgi:DNA repair exonuclease SbcCD ATPase subunit
MTDDFPNVAVGILTTSTYEEIAETYNRVCLDNFNLRKRLQEIKSVNDRVIEEEKKYNAVKNALEEDIQRYKKKIVNNNAIFLRALELFQQQLRKIAALKRNKNSICSSCGDPHSAVPELVDANATQVRQLEQRLNEFCAKVKDSVPSSSSSSSFLDRNVEDDYYDEDFEEERAAAKHADAPVAW